VLSVQGRKWCKIAWMNRHIATIKESEFDQLISGKRNYLVKFFKKKPDFLGKLSLGDTVFFKKEKGEITGQFEIGKLVIIENPDREDWGLVEKYENGLTREKYLDIVLTFRFILFLKKSEFAISENYNTF
jgi:hypothetical protein